MSAKPPISRAYHPPSQTRGSAASVPTVSQPSDVALSFKPIGALAADVLAKVRPQ